VPPRTTTCQTGRVTDLIERCAELPRRTFRAGELLSQQGRPFGSIIILVEGSIAVERDDVTLAIYDAPGAILGEMSTVLDRSATADLRAVTDATALVADDGAAFLLSRPDVLLDVARTLATRLDNLTGHLTDIKRQYGNDSGHLGMLDDVVRSLMTNPTRTVSPGSARMPDPDY
jgi:CRP/FNR family transcriptional regulator, cyclic AMP receptor protein